jgi:hypothetical protein
MALMPVLSVHRALTTIYAMVISSRARKLIKPIHAEASAFRCSLVRRSRFLMRVPSFNQVNDFE